MFQEETGRDSEDWKRIETQLSSSNSLIDGIFIDHHPTDQLDTVVSSSSSSSSSSGSSSSSSSSS